MSLAQEPDLQPVPVDRHAIEFGHGAGLLAVQVWLLLQVLLVSIEVEVAHDGVPQSEPTVG